MLKYILLIATLFLIGVNGLRDHTHYHSGRSGRSSMRKGEKYFELTKHNMALLKGTVSDTTVDLAIRDLYNVESDDVYLYIDTYGGSVIAGTRLIEVIKMLQEQDVVVHCIGDTAMSMGFATFLSCNRRYVLPTSMLMQHQMALGLGYAEFNKQRNRLDFYEQIEMEELTRESTILNKTLDEYRNLVNDEWYLYGTNALRHGVAHSLAHVSCSHDLMTSKFHYDVYTWFGTVRLWFSRCPLIKGFLSYEFLDGKVENVACNTEPKKEIINQTPVGSISISYKVCGDIVLPINVELTTLNRMNNRVITKEEIDVLTQELIN